MTRSPATPNDHASHDPAVIAALAAHPTDLQGADTAASRARLESCGACADLFADMLAVSAAIPGAAIPSRPRDFTLTPADAARLRPAGWRRIARAVGSARDGFTLPLAMGLTTLGIAGLLVATVPSFGVGGSGAGTTMLTPAEAPAASGAPAAEGTESLAMSAEPEQSGDTEGGVFTGGDPGDAAQSPGAGPEAAARAEDAAIRDDPTGLSVLVVVAGAMLILGLGLFGLRWSARRLGDG